MNRNVRELRDALNKIRRCIYYAFINDEGELWLYDVPEDAIPTNAKALIKMAINETAGLPLFDDVAGKEARDG